MGIYCFGHVASTHHSRHKLAPLALWETLCHLFFFRGSGMRMWLRLATVAGSGRDERIYEHSYFVTMRILRMKLTWRKVE